VLKEKSKHPERMKEKLRNLQIKKERILVAVARPYKKY
jgi:hypothetical protein